MSVLEAIDKGARFSVELVPPARGSGLDELFRAVEAVMPHGPAFASVTDHQGGSAYSESPAGPVLRPLRPKPGTLGTALALERCFGVRTVPHIVASGQDRFLTEDLLIDLHYAGFRDLFVIRGDPRRVPAAPAFSPGRGYARAVDLVAHVAALNRGEYLSGEEGRERTCFELGVAGYPGKHFEAPNLDFDIARLKEKLGTGATYVVTQMVFDPEEYFRYVELLRAAGIEAPVIPGIKPITRAAQALSVPGSFLVDIPGGLLGALQEARSPVEERAAGIAWAARSAERLLAGGAPALHFFTMGRGAATRDVLDALFGPKGGREGRAA